MRELDDKAREPWPETGRRGRITKRLTTLSASVSALLMLTATAAHAASYNYGDDSNSDYRVVDWAFTKAPASSIEIYWSKLRVTRDYVDASFRVKQVVAPGNSDYQAPIIFLENGTGKTLGTACVHSTPTRDTVNWGANSSYLAAASVFRDYSADIYTVRFRRGGAYGQVGRYAAYNMRGYMTVKDRAHSGYPSCLDPRVSQDYVGYTGQAWTP